MTRATGRVAARGCEASHGLPGGYCKAYANLIIEGGCGAGVAMWLAVVARRCGVSLRLSVTVRRHGAPLCARCRLGAKLVQWRRVCRVEVRAALQRGARAARRTDR